ncbi:MAG: DsbA family protein, partial [Myxococcales bacterium]|nr:DsbA family protein [Myxococcales bacterium]
TGAQFDDDELVKIARKLGLDVRSFKQEMHGDVHDARIAADMGLARELGIRGTPAYFINGRAIAGAVPEMEFRLTILEELERAEAALAAGVKRAELYPYLTTHLPEE